MDKSSKAVDEALKRLREVEAALTASKPLTNERAMLAFAVVGAEREYRAALRAGRKPHADCGRCKCRIKPGQPMVWQWRHGRSVPLCLRCHRTKHKGVYAGRLAESDQRPCEVCARPMYLDGFSLYGISRQARQPLTCSYQCNYRRKIKHQLERKRVEHATVACVVCGEMFTQARRDAKTCSATCRQKLFRHRRSRPAASGVSSGVTGARH